MRIFLAFAALLAAILAATPAQADGPSDEQKFLQQAQHFPMYVLPKGRDSLPADILAGGYRACAVMDRYPYSGMRAAHVYFDGGNTIDGDITPHGWDFMAYSAYYLCNRHANMYHQVSEDGLFDPGGPYYNGGR